MAGILCIARNSHRRGDHRSPAFVAQSKIASLVQREVVPNGTGGIVTEQKRLKEYGTTPQALTRQLPLHRGAEPRANHDKRTVEDAGPYRIKTYAHPAKQNSPPFSKSFERGMGETFLQESFPHRIPLQLKPSSPSLRRGECPRGHCSQRRRSARRAHGAASYRAKSCARAAPCRTHRAAPTDRTRANPESC